VRAECFSIDLFADCSPFPFGFSASPCKIGVGSVRLLVCVYFHVSLSSYPACVVFSRNCRSNVYVGTYTIEAVLWKKHMPSFINDVIVD